MLILVLNSGSSSIKFALRQVPDAAGDGAGAVLAAGVVERIGDGPAGMDTATLHGRALDAINQEISGVLAGRRIDAVGHRVVHGGERFFAPTLLTGEIVQELEQLSALAPLHNPASMLGIRAVGAFWPGTPQVAVFDTAFHRTLPESAWRYAIPDELYRRHGIRRYGFHGTSVEYVTGHACTHLGIPVEEFDGVVAHLGNGASLTAIRGGASIDTSMGFTPLAGLVMGTRCGDIDPSIVLYLQRQGMDADAIEELLDVQSGLRALCGLTDMRAVQDAADAGEAHAILALESAAYRLAKYIGGYHVAVGGAKYLVFTAGIGENSWQFRSLVVAKLAPLGAVLDQEANQMPPRGPRTISTPDSALRILVVPTDEDRAIAESTAAVVRDSQVRDSQVKDSQAKAS